MTYFKILFLWLLLLLATILIISPDIDWLAFLKSWDGGHFLGIAEHGYKYDFQLAFYPLFPISIKLIWIILPIPTQIIGFLLNLIFLIILLKYFKKLIELDFKEVVATRAIIALLLSPVSFFLLLPYSETLFLLLTVLSFYYIRKDRVFFGLLFASLSFVTRPLGLATILAVFYEIYLIRKSLNPKYLLTFMPFAVFLVFGWIQTHQKLFFIHTEEYWQRTLALPGQNIIEAVREVRHSNAIFRPLSELIALFFGLLFTALAFIKLRRSYFIYILLSLMLPLFTSKLTSLPRFLLVLFPIFILLGLIKNRYYFFFIEVASVLGLIYFLNLFLQGAWVS